MGQCSSQGKSVPKVTSTITSILLMLLLGCLIFIALAYQCCIVLRTDFAHQELFCHTRSTSSSRGGESLSMMS
jgi:hypothetical protein